MPSRPNRPTKGRQASPLLSVLLESRNAWLAVFVFSMAINFLMLAPTIYMMQISDRVISSRSMVTLAVLTLITLLALGVMAMLEWARTRIMVRIGVRLDSELSPKLAKLTHRFSIEAVGDRGGRLLGDLMMLRMFLTGYGALAALDAPWVPIFFFFTLALHPTLALTVLFGGVVIVILTFITENITRGPLERSSASATEAAAFMANNMRHSEVIEAMGMLPAILKRWQAKQHVHLIEQATASDRAGLTTSASKFVRQANQALAMGVGGFLFVSTDVSPGIIFAASLLSSRIMAPIEQILATWSQWGNAREAWARVNEALTHVEKTTAGITLPTPKGEIALEGVFGGPPGIPSAFIQNVNLKIPAGASVAVIGASASGKSSLMRLLAGVWAPRVGTVRIDGADVRTWPREELGPHIGYLPQDVELIEGSVAENIARFGDIDSERVIAAAQAAGVHEMILQLSDGYGTQVGVNGAFLSGGQRQRIALARAMYGNPPILLLDEPNANLDEAGELALDVALGHAKARGQTVVIISHRPIAIRNCDLVMVTQAGMVSLYGPRELVLAKLASVAGVKPGAPAAGGPTAAAMPAPPSGATPDSNRQAELAAHAADNGRRPPVGRPGMPPASIGQAPRG